MMLRETDQNLWVAEQPLRYFGLSVGTRMTVIRLPTQVLALISPISIDDAIAAQLETLGTVQHIIAPNLFHSLFAASAKTRYPTATFWAVSGLEAKRPDLLIDQWIPNEGYLLVEGLEYCFFNFSKDIRNF